MSRLDCKNPVNSISCITSCVMSVEMEATVSASKAKSAVRSHFPMKCA